MQLSRLVCVVVGTALLFCGSVLGQAPSSRPNILFVLIDDMGYRDLSCFGGTRVKTPEIDRLAAEGLRFNQFYVSSPICSPSRVALTTGQHPSRWRVTSFLSSREEDRRRDMADWLAVEAPSLARALAAGGYHTAHVGKWHMGGQRDVADAPPISAYGFATSLTNFEGLGPRILPKFENQKHGPTETSAKFGGAGAEWAPRHEVSQRFVDRAIAEMDAAKARKQPFYVNLWPDDVHSPFQPPPELRGDGSKEAGYLGVLRELDRQLGRAFEHVRADPALRDNTLILLASDNGHEPGAGTGGTLRGQKGQLYEGGIRSPLIAWGPGVLPKSAQPGTSNDRTVIAGVDVPPTLLAVAGVAAPQGVQFDGRDVSAALLGTTAEPRDGAVMWVRPPDRPGPAKNPMPDLAIREGNWKLLVRRDGSSPELFDVTRDPDETTNLAASEPDLTKRLSEAVIAWDRATAGNALAAAATTAPATPSTARSGKPHIVLVIADDMSWHDIGPYGNADVRTPHLDRLATESLQFERAFSASPTCTPSRSALYTGMYPVRNGAHANHSLVREGTRTLPALLKEQGYRVVLAGKTHIGPRPQFPFEYLADSNVMPPGKNHVLWTDLGVEGIDKLLATHDRDARPLCLIAAAHSPHVYWPDNDGYDPAKLKLPPYFLDTPQTRAALARYYTDVTHLDGQVGAIRASLARHGYADDTLFMFTADQGAQFPFAKWSLSDAGIRVPLLVHWPGKVKGGTTTGAMASLIDLLPTMIHAAGGTPPADMDGRSLLEVLTGKADAHREEVYAAHTGDREMNRAPMRCVRTARFKYIANLAPQIAYTTHVSKDKAPDGYWQSWVKLAEKDAAAAKVIQRYEHRPAEELYDVKADPHELNNLAADPAHAQTLAELREKVKAWRVQQGEDLSKPLMPEDVREGAGPRYAG